MKKLKVKITGLIVLGIVMSFSPCKKDSDDPEPQPQNDYAVRYSLDITGEYDSLLVAYFGPASGLVEVENPGSSWDINLMGYSAGDSVYLEFAFRSRPFKEVLYQYSVDVHQQGNDYIENHTESYNFTPGDTALPVRVSWGYKIPEQ